MELEGTRMDESVKKKERKSKSERRLSETERDFFFEDFACCGPRAESAVLAPCISSRPPPMGPVFVFFHLLFPCGLHKNVLQLGPWSGWGQQLARAAGKKKKTKLVG